MGIRGRRLTAALLALCIALGLAACGSGGQETDENAQQLSGKVYVPKFVDLDMDFDYINSGCCDGQYVYLEHYFFDQIGIIQMRPCPAA